LNKGYVVFAFLGRQAAAHGADDTHAGGVIQAKGRADGHYPFTHPQLVGLSQLDHWQLLGVNLQQRQIRAGILADDFGIEFAAINQADCDLAGAINHMVVSEDIAIVGNNKTRAHGIGIAFRHSLLLEQLTEYLRHLLAWRQRHTATPHLLHSVDLHHCR